LPQILEADFRPFEFRHTSPITELHKRLPDEQLAIPTNFRPYDVLHYDLILDWYEAMNKPMKLDTSGFGYLTKEDLQWSGVVQMTIKADAPKLDTVRVDAASLTITEVQVDGLTIIPLPSVINDELIIPLKTSAVQNQELKININYRHERFNGIGGYRGFYLYPKRMYIGQIPVPPNDSAFIEERIAYTMSEPQDARYWVPCNDSPHDKATVAIRVRVPKGYSAASNGLLLRIDQNDTASTYVWYSDQVMTTYLMHVTVSKFKEWSDWYHKVTNPNDSIEIKYYVWQKDYDATKKDQSEYNARWAFEQNVDQLICYSKAYGEYPFKKYGIVSIQPFTFGGMEHQTITSINRVWLRTNARGGLAHELAHMWLGDLITCRTWNDIWINEGGATFSEAIWTEYQAGRQYYFWDMLGKRAYYMAVGGSKLPPIYGLPINTIFGGNAVLVYQKSSWIYHMLRTMVGDSVFFPALRNVLAKNSFKSLDTEKYKKAFEQEIPEPAIPLETYFKQWLTKQGHPVFNMSVSTSNAGKDRYIATVNLSQVQPKDSISDIFEVPVRILFADNNGNVVADTIIQKSRQETKDVLLPFYPTSVAIDTSHILCEVNEITTSVKLNPEANDCKYVNVFPNPLVRGNTGYVAFNNNENNNVTIEISDIFGRKVKQIFNAFIEAGSYRVDFSTSDFPTGTYIIMIRSGNRLITAKLELI
jgi:aminopeptidase N